MAYIELSSSLFGRMESHKIALALSTWRCVSLPAVGVDERERESFSNQDKRRVESSDAVFASIVSIDCAGRPLVACEMKLTFGAASVAGNGSHAFDVVCASGDKITSELNVLFFSPLFSGDLLIIQTISYAWLQWRFILRISLKVRTCTPQGSPRVRKVQKATSTGP
ncbi:hypothetical protein GOP47_0009931 [Adiantum capillus-veneris]|uniref:Uncharacterized protein n=1 Tax=Adiantum capillus-veneris TaxID=13818 RepID=A0A9D4UX80_ADICA|nr:hypothetical protein GOP47_0009931 [Adiantum capillus-veneris]